MLTRKQYTALVFVTLFGSFAGGAVMEWLLTGKGARAEEAESVVRVDRFEAREFRVVDDAGKPRACLKVLVDGTTSASRLELSAKDTKASASLTVFAGGSFLSLSGKDMTASAGLGVLAGTPHLSLSGKDAKEQAGLIVYPDGTPHLSLSDKAGKARAGLWLLPDGTPHLSLGDKAGKERASLALFADGSPSLRLSDKDRKGRASLAVLPDGSPFLSLHDKDGKPRAVLGCTSLRDKRTESVEQRQESSLVLFKSDGDVLWQAP